MQHLVGLGDSCTTGPRCTRERGIRTDALSTNKESRRGFHRAQLWWHGPDFLITPEVHWPTPFGGRVLRQGGDDDEDVVTIGAIRGKPPFTTAGVDVLGKLILRNLQIIALWERRVQEQQRNNDGREGENDEDEDDVDSKQGSPWRRAERDT
eukprot:GHVS01066999.1.p2 GENE.GHVS01066999.1~~GHVS01066999.1.p2  ORF type:complete len:152 (+),score=16.89 GHVS01066999.1:782-1237(+)